MYWYILSLEKVIYVAGEYNLGVNGIMLYWNSRIKRVVCIYGPTDN